MARSKAEVRDRFSIQIAGLASTAKALCDALIGKARRVNLQLDRGSWGGDLFDLEGLASAFDRSEHREDVEAAISDPTDPGTVGDLAASAFQGDYLACLERSTRAAAMTRVRRSMHAAARRAGQGHDAGLFLRGVLGNVSGILKQSKETSE